MAVSLFIGGGNRIFKEETTDQLLQVTDRHDITKILLKVALDTLTLTLTPQFKLL